MDRLDRKIIGHLQTGFPLCQQPFGVASTALGVDENTLLARLKALLEDGVLSRFGPLFNIERSGGAFSLCAMRVPPDRFDEVAALVNQFPEVAHNYERDHRLNMWFVLGTETPAAIEDCIAKIERLTSCKVLNFPKEKEFFVGLRFEI